MCPCTFVCRLWIWSWPTEPNTRRCNCFEATVGVGPIIRRSDHRPSESVIRSPMPIRKDRAAVRTVGIVGTRGITVGDIACVTIASITVMCMPYGQRWVSASRVVRACMCVGACMPEAFVCLCVCPVYFHVCSCGCGCEHSYTLC